MLFHPAGRLPGGADIALLSLRFEQSGRRYPAVALRPHLKEFTLRGSQTLNNNVCATRGNDGWPAHAHPADDAGSSQDVEPPFRPEKLHSIAIGLLAGLLLGAALAFMAEGLETSLKTPEEVERLIAAPALAVIPQLHTNRHRPSWLKGHGEKYLSPNARAELAVPERPSSSLAESYRRPVWQLVCPNFLGLNLSIVGRV